MVVAMTTYCRSTLVLDVNDFSEANRGEDLAAGVLDVDAVAQDNSALLFRHFSKQYASLTGGPFPCCCQAGKFLPLFVRHVDVVVEMKLISHLHATLARQVGCGI